MLAGKHRNEVLIAIAALAIAAAWLPIRMWFPFDDTYITFRYAANLAHGFGIVWNPGGAHTEGYTNFLFMLMLVPFSSAGIDLAVASQAIGVLAVIVSAIALRRIVLRGSVELISPMSHAGNPNSPPNTHWVGWLAVALFLLDPFTWINAYSGLETSLFTLWLMLVIAAVVLRMSWTVAFCFATLAALTRPEGSLMGPILLLAARWTIPHPRNSKNSESIDRLLPLRSFAIAFVLPLTAYAVWKLWYFGDLLPNSFYVKVAQPKVQWVGVLPGYGTLRNGYKGVWYLVVLATLGIWFAGRDKRRNALATTIRSVDDRSSTTADRASTLLRNAAFTIPILWIALLTTFYLFSHLIQAEYQRFVSSIEAMLIVLVGVASTAYLKDADRTPHRVPSHPARYVLLLAGIVIFHVAWSLYPRGGLSYAERDSEFLSSYTRVARVLASIPGHEHITLAWGDAGRLPYLSGIRHIDPIGLNTNEIAHAHSAEQIIGFLLRSRPEMIVVPLIVRDKSTRADSCRAIIPIGECMIANAYPELATRAFAAGYKSIVVIPQTVYDLDVLADSSSPHYRDIVQTLVARIGHDSDFLMPPACIRPARFRSKEPLLYSFGRRMQP